MKIHTGVARFVLTLMAALSVTAVVSAQTTQNPVQNQTVHIMVGRSVIINSQARFTRVVVANPVVVETLTTSPTQVVVTAKAPGSSSLMLWDENGRTRVMEVYADLDVTALRDAIQQSFPAQQIQVEGQEGRVILAGTATPAMAEQMVKMAGNYSKDVVNSLVQGNAPRQKQIMLKVRFAEVDRSKLQAFGINLLSTGLGNTVGTVTTQQFGNLSAGSNNRITGTILGPGGQGQNTGFSSELGISDLLNIFLFRPDLNLGATIKDLQQKNVLQILAEPNLMSMSGETAHFLAGGELPYPVLQGTAGASTVTIQFKQFGVKLDFTGTIEDGEIIRLKVMPEVSSLDFSNAVTISGFVLPAISTRRAETQIELKSGQSFGIAGLMDQRTTVLLSKVPGIGDIPILGNLFKSRSTNRTNQELLVLVTPTVIDPLLETQPTPEPILPMKNLQPKEFDKGLPNKSLDSKEQKK